MVVKVNQSFEKTRHVKNNDRSKKYILRGQRNVRYYQKVLSNKKKSYININLSNFSKIIVDTGLKFSGYSYLSTSYPMTYHTLL